MGIGLIVSTQLETFGTCCVCGIEWAAPAAYVKKRREGHENFYCPNGHGQHFPAKTEAEILREQLAAEKKATEQLRAAVLQREQQAAQAQRDLADLKARVGKGVCPCCHRSFTNLRRHMATKHPDTAGAPS